MKIRENHVDTGLITNLAAKACRSILGISFTVTFFRVLFTDTTWKNIRMDKRSKCFTGCIEKQNTKNITCTIMQYLCQIPLVVTTFYSSPHALRNFRGSTSNREQMINLTIWYRCHSSNIDPGNPLACLKPCIRKCYQHSVRKWLWTTISTTASQLASTKPS